MNIKELEILIKAAKDLRLEDIELVLNDSRDGEVSYPKATANFVIVDEYKALAFSHE